MAAETPPIEIRGLTKDYGEGRGVFDLDLTVRAGEVYGFLGPNGAGKTTVMRTIVGHVRADRGQVLVHGGAPSDPSVADRVGALIEMPALYGHLSGRDNLRYFALHAGRGAAAVDDALRQVDMEGAAHRRVSTYSLGMRQRLGVAAALLKNPSLLLLDEPTNGLDPEGIVGMRELVRRMRDQGRTVFLSSHQMSEIEVVCDRVGVLRQGRLVAEDTVEGLSQAPSAVPYTISTPEPERAAALVGARAAVADVRVGEGRLDLVVRAEDVPAVIRELVLEGVPLHGFAPAHGALETAFFGLVGSSAGMGTGS